VTLASRGGNRDQDDLVEAGTALGLRSGSLGGAEVGPSAWCRSAAAPSPRPLWALSQSSYAGLMLPDAPELGVANNSQQVFNVLLHRVRHLSDASTRVVRAVFSHPKMVLRPTISWGQSDRSAQFSAGAKDGTQQQASARSAREQRSGVTRLWANIGWALEHFPACTTSSSTSRASTTC